MEIDSEGRDPGVKVHVQSVETASTGLRAASSSRDQLNLSEASTSATPSQIHQTEEQEVPKSVDVLPNTDAKKDEIQAVPALPTSVTHPSISNPTSSAPLGITGNYLAQVLKNLGKDPREKQRSLAEVLQADRIAPLLQSSSVKHRLAALQEFLPAEHQDEFSSDVCPFLSLLDTSFLLTGSHLFKLCVSPIKFCPSDPGVSTLHSNAQISVSDWLAYPTSWKPISSRLL